MKKLLFLALVPFIMSSNIGAAKRAALGEEYAKFEVSNQSDIVVPVIYTEKGNKSCYAMNGIPKGSKEDLSGVILKSSIVLIPTSAGTFVLDPGIGEQFSSPSELMYYKEDLNNPKIYEIEGTSNSIVILIDEDGFVTVTPQ